MCFPQKKSLGFSVHLMQKTNTIWVTNTKILKEMKLLERLLESFSKAPKMQTLHMPCVTNETTFNESPGSLAAASAFSQHYPPFASSRSCQFILNPKHYECFSIHSFHSLVLATCQFERKEKPRHPPPICFICFLHSVSFPRTLPVSKWTHGFQVQKSLYIQLLAHKPSLSSFTCH